MAKIINYKPNFYENDYCKEIVKIFENFNDELKLLDKEYLKNNDELFYYFYTEFNKIYTNLKTNNDNFLSPRYRKLFIEKYITLINDDKYVTLYYELELVYLSSIDKRILKEEKEDLKHFIAVIDDYISTEEEFNINNVNIKKILKFLLDNDIIKEIIKNENNIHIAADVFQMYFKENEPIETIMQEYKKDDDSTKNDFSLENATIEDIYNYFYCASELICYYNKNIIKEDYKISILKILEFNNLNPNNKKIFLSVFKRVLSKFDYVKDQIKAIHYLVKTFLFIKENNLFKVLDEDKISSLVAYSYINEVENISDSYNDLLKLDNLNEEKSTFITVKK